MIELTVEQRIAISKADDPIVVDPETKERFVLVRAEHYVKMKAIVDRITKRSGWDDPELDVYESYRKPQ